MKAHTFTFRQCDNGWFIGPNLPLKPSWEQLKNKLKEILNYMCFFGINFAFNPNNKEKIVINKLIEKKISNHADLSLAYACYFLKDRFVKGEKQISKDTQCALIYAVIILKKRFLEGEKSIAKDSRTCLEYCIHIFKRKKLPKEMHNMMLFHKIKNPNDKFVKRYLKFKGVANI